MPAARMDPNALRLLQLYPQPTSAGLLNNYTTSPPNSTNSNSMDARVDHQFGQNNSAFLRYSYVFTTQDYPSPFPGVADGGASRPGTGRTESQNGALSWTHIFTPHLVNEARVGYSRIYDKRLQPFANTLGIPAQYGIPGVPQVNENGGLPLFEFGTLSALGANTTLPSDKASDVFQVTENVTRDLDRHQIRSGLEFQHVAFPMLTPPESRGDFVNSGLFTSVVNSTDGSTDRAQFLLIPQISPYGSQFNYLGGADNLSASNYPPAYYPIRNNYGVYAEDSWRATQNLTLNFGLRYDFLGVPAERDGRVGNFVPAQTGDSPDGLTHYYIPQQHLAELPAALTALFTANGVVVTPTNDNSIGRAQGTNFAPRVGFALQPSKNVSVRGGYGVFYQANESHGLSSAPYVNFPFEVQSSYSAGSAVQAIIANPVINTTPEGTVGPLSQGLQNVPLTPSTASVTSLQFEGEPRYPKTAYSQSYNLQTQFQISPNTILFLGYIGDNSRHIQDRIPINTTLRIAPPSTSLPSIAFFPTIATGGQYVSHHGSGNYNSLQFGAERRFSSGLSFTANMTYSKCLGDIRDMLDATIGAVRAPYVPGVGLSADYTLCETDVRRIVHTSGTYELPFGKNRHFLHEGIGAWIAGGWSTNWIFTAQDGQPFSVPCSKKTASGLGCFALRVPGQNLYAGPHNATQFLNPHAFANPPAVGAGTTGTVANLGGPGAQVTGSPYRRLDLSIFRQFASVGESHFEFRAEVFNLTNTPNLGTPGSLNFTSPSTFSIISGTRDNPNDPREMQLSLKCYF
jgi:roadblock/LC7 domain-containing protein